MPVAFLLLPVLEHHGDVENEKSVDAHDTEGSGEDEIEILVGCRREFADAATLLRSYEVIDAGSVDLKGARRGRIEVAAAIKLCPR